MERRELLRASGAALAGTAVGATMLAQTPDRTSAATVAPTGLTIDGTERTTPNGLVRDVNATTDAQWSYDLPGGKNAATWRLALVATDGESQTTIDETSGEAKYLTFSGDATLSGSVLDADGYTAEMFAALEADTVTTVTVGLGLRFSVTTPDGEELARATTATTAEVEITNRGWQATEYGNVGGDGSVSVTTPTPSASD